MPPAAWRRALSSRDGDFSFLIWDSFPERRVRRICRAGYDYPRWLQGGQHDPFSANRPIATSIKSVFQITMRYIAMTSLS